MGGEPGVEVIRTYQTPSNLPFESWIPWFNFISINMKSFIVGMLGLASLTLAAPSDLAARETDVQATDRLLFSSSIGSFISARNARSPATLDWSSDGCSDSPDNPFGFNCRIPARLLFLYKLCLLLFS